MATSDLGPEEIRRRLEEAGYLTEPRGSTQDDASYTQDDSRLYQEIMRARMEAEQAEARRQAQMEPLEEVQAHTYPPILAADAATISTDASGGNAWFIGNPVDASAMNDLQDGVGVDAAANEPQPQPQLQDYVHQQYTASIGVQPGALDATQIKGLIKEAVRELMDEDQSFAGWLARRGGRG